MLPENPLIRHMRTLNGDNKIFLVGGSVRDLLEDKDMKDFDFLIEGDVFNFALLLANSLNCKLTLNRQLLTASLMTKWGNVDIARARTESYANPGALPTVTPATWQEDLHRRDFTVNALAIPLLQTGWGKVIDLSGGQKDIADRLIRIMHENSFQDDPTRMLRALRLKNRLGYKIEDKTYVCMQRDWEYLGRLSPARCFKEWVLMSAEPVLPDILRDLYEFGGWAKYLPGIPYVAGIIKGLSEIKIPEKTRGFRPGLLYLLVLLNISQGSLDYFADAWELPKRDVRGLAATLDVLRQEKIPSRKKRKLYSKISKLPLEGIYFIYGQLFSERFAWIEFYESVRCCKMPLDGQDLILLGLEPGPEFGAILNRLEEDYEMNIFDTKEEGLELAAQLARRLIEEDKEC